MPKRVQGFSLSEEAVEAAQRLSRARGLSASRFVNDLLLREAGRRGVVPEVLVDGVRFVPARGRRA